MRLARAWMGLCAIAGSLAIMAGCVQPSEVSPAPAGRTGKVTLFERPDGLGQIALQVIDQRRSTQALGLADDWDEVRVRLTSSKLRSPRATSIALGDSGFATPRQSTYVTDTLGQLPPASDYQLMVTIASQSVVLGQGASESISVLPGSVATVSLYVNTVGNISFYNADYVTGIGTSLLASASLGYPELLANSTVDVSPNFPTTPPSVPESQRFATFYTELRSLSGSLLLATSSVSATGPQSLALPTLPPGTDEAIQRVTVVGLNSSNEVIATKTRNILVLRGAGLNVDLNPSPSPTPAAAFVAPSATSTRVRTGPAIRSTGPERP